MRAHATSTSIRHLFSWSPRTGLVAWIVGGLLLYGGLAPSHAQIDTPDIQRMSASTPVETGVRLLKEGRAKEAIPLLRSTLSTDPARVVPPHGAVAYWLGRAYDQAGQLDKAQSTRRTGLRDLQAAGQFDPRLADAYLQNLTPEQLRGERLHAAEVYQSLLRRVGTDTSSAARSLFRRRVAQLAPLMADSALARVIEQDRSAPAGTWTFRPDAGQSLVRWWRGFDPFPATDENERLEEHLTRLIRVRQNYRCPGRISGLDDRGIAKLRFGDPYKRRELNYEDGEFFQEVYRFGVNVPPSSFPKSEIWLYTHIDDAGFYLFAEQDTSDCFKIAKANELMPSYLTRQRGNSERGLNIAYSALMAMRAIYRELALYHINFSNRYTEIANYAGWQEMQSMASRAGGESNVAGQRSVQVGAGVGQTRRVFSNPNLGYDFPTQFVTRMVSRARQEDRRAADRREEAMPRQHTTLLDGAAQLPVSVRTARFLETDGTTRTEVYWGVPATALPMGEDDSLAASLLTVSAVRYDRDRRPSERKRRRYPVDVSEGTDTRMLVPEPLTFRGVTELHHLGLQWGQHQLWPTDSTSSRDLRMGPKRRMATARADSMQSLRAKGPQVEMSDVKVLAASGTDFSPAAPMQGAKPYPFRTISPGTPLLLSFEVYHLSYNADDRTQYTVSYEAEGETKRGWTELFRGTDTQRTSTEMTMEGTSRRTTETIRLDLSQIERDEPQDVRVTVRVTDEETGATVSRDVEFVLRPDAEGN